MEYITDNSTQKQVKKMVKYPRTLTTCSLNLVKIPELMSYFEKTNLSKMFCLNPDEEFYMEGDFDA